MEKRLSNVYFVEYEVELEKSNSEVKKLREKRIITIGTNDGLGIGLARSILDTHGNEVSDIKLLDIRPL